MLAAIAVADENWIGYSSPTVSALPANLQNGIPTVLPPAEASLQHTDTLKYDDNSAANAWAWNQADNGWGVKFMRPANPTTLVGALVHLWAATWPVPGSDRFKVKVFQADGPAGAPGTQLWSSGVLTGTRGAWNFVPINIPVIDYDFYIFYVQPDTYPACPGVSIDARVNVPDNVTWTLQGFNFAPGGKEGDWLIRAVLDWADQTNNVGPMYFGNLPMDTIPNINLPIQASFKNFGTATLGSGVPVKMQITGPMGYVRDWTTDTTTGTWPAKGIKTLTYGPPWHIPDTAGIYTIKAWSDLPTDEYRGNDTMTRTLSATKWQTYANWGNPYWISFDGPQRATLFDPADFQLQYPLDISRVRAEFYLDSRYPVDDSLFQFAIYSENGDSLWTSDTVRARTYPSATETGIVPPVRIASGLFYAAVIPRSMSGHPTHLGDSTPQGKSWFGSPNNGWTPWNRGEYFVAVSARTNLAALSEGSAIPAKPMVLVLARPNPSALPVISWQIPSSAPVKITLYDAAGREARIFRVNRSAAALAGSWWINASDLNPGVYLVRLTAGTSKASTKLVLSR